MNSSIAAGPNSGAIRRSVSSAATDAFTSFALRALPNLSSSGPYELKKLTTFGLLKAASNFFGSPAILMIA